VLFKKFFVAVVMLFAALACMAESVEGLPFHIKKIGPDILRVWVGDYISSTAVTAMATEKGIVVIDSTDIPKLDQAFRKIFVKELGRSDFKFLINTHGHGDHTNGNGVYADCQIIAHETVPAMMEENFRNIARNLDWNKENNKQQNEIINSEKSSAEQKAIAKEQLILNTLFDEFLRSSPKPFLPTKTFKDKLILDCGNLSLELYQAGGTHTRSDIFILIPQKKILFTGDMMADKWLSETPGCLATFAIRSGSAEDYPVLVKNWQILIDRKNEISHYIPGHWNGELSYDGFRKRFEYLKTMLTDVETLAKAGTDMNLFMADYTLKNKFPQLVNSPGITDQGHRMSINHLYVIFSGKMSLSDAVQGLLQSENFAAEFDKLKYAVLSSKEKYFFNEAEINGLGYFSLQQLRQIDNAIKLFELNAELFPGSWNAYDSLAEAWLIKGDKQKAQTLYRKSVELNPANENGKKMLEQIEKE